MSPLEERRVRCGDRPTPPPPPRSLSQGAGGCYRTSSRPRLITPSPEDRGRGFIKGGGGLTPAAAAAFRKGGQAVRAGYTRSRCDCAPDGCVRRDQGGRSARVRSSECLSAPTRCRGLDGAVVLHGLAGLPGGLAHRL